MAGASETSGDRSASAGKAAYEPRSEDVLRWLREAINDGRLKPGERVGQEAIAGKLGVSRIPVREALRRLESEGLVVIRPHSTARVARLDFAEYEEIYKMRERLEPLALAESMKRLTEAQIAHATELARELETLRPDPAAWLEGDRKLHHACYAGLSTPRLLKVIVGFWNVTHPYRRVLLTTFADRDFELQHKEHDLIVDALATGNARAGEDLMRAHIERSRLRLTLNRHLFEG